MREKRVHFELSAECVCACMWVGVRAREGEGEEERVGEREKVKEEVDISIFWGESNCRNTHFKVIPTPQAPESFLKRIRSWLLAKKQSKTSSWKRGLPFILVHFRKNVLTPFRKNSLFLTFRKLWFCSPFKTFQLVSYVICFNMSEIELVIKIIFHLLIDSQIWTS